MANGGTTGDDLERLRVQVDATRTELGEVAGAVSGLTELVTDLIRRSTTDHQGDRWQARLGSLETRLEMLETSIRVEVERIRATVGAVDALADDFKTTVGGTHNLVDLAANISDRIGTLESLERGVRGAAQDIATSVEDRLDREASDRQHRDDSLAERVGGVLERVDQLAASAREQAAARSQLDEIDRSVAQTQEGLAALASRLEGVAQVTADLPSMEDRLSSQLRDATAWGDVLGRLSTQVGGVHNRLDETATVQSTLADTLTSVSNEVGAIRTDLDSTSEATRKEVAATLSDLVTEIRGLGARIDDTSATADLVAEIQGLRVRIDAPIAPDSRLDDIATAVAQVRSHQPQLTVRLDQLAVEVSALQSTLAHPDDGDANIGERLDALAAAMRQVVSSQPDPRPQLEQLAAIVEALRSGQPDVTERVDRLSAQIAALAANLPDAREPLERMTTELASLRAEQRDPTASLERLTAELASMRAEQHDPSEPLERLTAELASMRAEQHDPSDQFARLAEEIAGLRTTQPDHREAIERIADEVGALRAAQPDPADLAARVREQISALGEPITAALADLRVDQPAIDFDPVVGRIDDVAALRHRYENVRAHRVAGP